MQPEQKRSKAWPQLHFSRCSTPPYIPYTVNKHHHTPRSKLTSINIVLFCKQGKSGHRDFEDPVHQSQYLRTVIMSP